MKKTLIKAAAIAALISANTAHAGFVDGYELHRLIEKKDMSAIGYIQGVADSENNLVFCIKPGVKTGQLVIATDEFLKSHPEYLNADGSSLVALTLMQHWPCPKKH